MVCGMLERYSGYTLESLLGEDVHLWQLTQIDALGRPPDETTGGGGL